MKCLSPIVINQKNRFTFYKQGIARGIEVPCGQCIACRLNYAKFWSIRMMQEMKKHDCACFVTLTYDDEHLPEDESLHKRDIQLFWKRLRKDRSVRYFCCGEYGDIFGRPHYHAIIYGISPQESDLINKHWDKGFIKIGTCTVDSCNYVAKYMTKKCKGKEAVEKWIQSNPGKEQEFVLMSRRPGIGGDLDDDMIEFIRENGFVYRKGFKSALPRYYKDKYNVETNLSDLVDLDDKILFLQNSEKIGNLIKKGLEFYKKC